MKKALSLLLSFALLFSIGIISANADDTFSSKLSPALRAAVADLNESDTVNIVVYFADKTLRINDMPDWDPSTDPTTFQSDHDASMHHAMYIAAHNYEITRQIFDPCESCDKFIREKTGKTYYTQVDFTLDGCCTARDITVADLRTICASPLVRSVDLFSKMVSGKYDPNLAVMLNAVDPEDWIEVGVHRAGSFKTVADMPSWPSSRGTLEETQEKIAAAREEYAAYQREIEAVFFAEAFEGVDVRYMVTGGNFAIIIVKAGDIETIASRDCVSDIEYFYNAIVENEADPPQPEDKINKKLSEATALDCCELPVYIELDFSAKQLQDMPSAPDFRASKSEYLEYVNLRLKALYDAALADLNEITPLTCVRSICNDALTAKVKNDYEAIKALAASDWVKSIRYFEQGDEWVTDHFRYDVNNTGTRYRERLVSQYGFLEKSGILDLGLYQELYYHPYARDDKPYGYDWALVAANFGGATRTEIYTQVVGGRLLEAPGYKLYPFTFNIGLYDTAQDRFFDLTEIDFNNYPGLYEAWQKLDIGELTDQEQLGDADGDMRVTILDATKIQRGIADLDSRNSIVATGADADGDGNMTVLDATRIQRFIADLCALDGTEKTPEKADDYEIGSILVSVQTGTPYSISKARNIALETLRDFELESIGMLASTESSAVFKVTLAEKSAENDQLAIETLEKNTAVNHAGPYRGEYSSYDPDGFEPGRIIVSGDYANLLKDFPIESTRLLTPGSGRSVILVIFKEKTKDVVWKALEILENAPRIEYACPDFYRYIEEIDE